MSRPIAFVCIPVFPFALLPGTVAVSAGKIAHTIQAQKDTIVLGEPAIISSTYRNESQLPVQIFFQNSPAYAGVGLPLSILRVSLDGREYEVWNDGLRSRFTLESPMLTLQSGEERTEQLVMFFHSQNGLVFNNPGLYWISTKAVALAPDGRGHTYYESKPVCITVRDPDGSDQAVWEWLNAHKDEYGRLVQIPRTAKLPKDFVNGCRERCAKSDSVYVEYIALFLSRWYAEGPGKDAAEAVRLAEIAKTRASSDTVRDLASKALARSKKLLSSATAGKSSEPPPPQPVDPEVREQVENVVQAFFGAGMEGDIEGIMKLTSEDFNGWSREKKREEFQDEINEVQELRRKGISVEVSAKVLSAVWVGKDVQITASITYRQGSDAPSVRTVHYLLRKYSDEWRLQDRIPRP